MLSALQSGSAGSDFVEVADACAEEEPGVPTSFSPDIIFCSRRLQSDQAVVLVVVVTALIVVSGDQ